MSFSDLRVMIDLAMSTASPEPHYESSHEGSPAPFDPLNMPKPKTNANANNPLLKLPDDIFRCVMDYLDASAAWSLKRLCKGMAASTTVSQSLYRYPIQLDDVRDIRLGDWKYRSIGLIRWESFKDSINDSNRQYVQRLAMSHWASIGDFRWIEENLPALTGLDISAIKDFVWTPEETWTWNVLAQACPKLFGRIEELEVANWADYTAHSRIEYNYSYNDYRFRQKFRLSRRRDGGSVAQMILPICTKLKMLAIRERYSGCHTWNEWEVHQRVCSLVDGVKNCSPTMTKLRVHDYAPYRSLFATDACDWSHLTHVEIGLYSWMEDRREREIIGPIPYRITQGNHHRDEEEPFDDKSMEKCDRDHMALGNHVVQGVGASFEDLLRNLQIIQKKYSTIKIQPIHNLQNITLHPFHLVNVMQRRNLFAAQHNAQQDPPGVLADLVANEEVQQALQWLAHTCRWKPILAWDSMMCDVFPANLEPHRAFLPKPDVLSRIKTMITGLRNLKIPVRISIGDRTNTCSTNGLDGSLYFGDFKAFVGEDEDTKHEVFLPTQASFNLSCIASMIDEITIQYPVDVPGVAGWMRPGKRPTAAEQSLMDREMTGWRRFWKRYACQFTNLKKLTVNVPHDIYKDWGKSDLATLLEDERWDVLEQQSHGGDYGFFGSYFPFTSSSLRYSFARKRGKTKFVQRVFFRLDDKPLKTRNGWAGHVLGELERDEAIIDDSEIADIEQGEHRFWPQEKSELSDEKVGAKRKRSDDAETAEDVEAKRPKFEDVLNEVRNPTVTTIDMDAVLLYGVEDYGLFSRA